MFWSLELNGKNIDIRIVYRRDLQSGLYILLLGAHSPSNSADRARLRSESLKPFSALHPSDQINPGETSSA